MVKLLNYGVSGKLMDVIRSMYESSGYVGSMKHV